MLQNLSAGHLSAKGWQLVLVWDWLENGIESPVFLKEGGNECWIQSKAEFQARHGCRKRKMIVGTDQNNNPPNTHTALKQRNRKERNPHRRLWSPMGSKVVAPTLVWLPVKFLYTKNQKPRANTLKCLYWGLFKNWEVQCKNMHWRKIKYPTTGFWSTYEI